MRTLDRIWVTHQRTTSQMGWFSWEILITCICRPPENKHNPPSITVPAPSFSAPHLRNPWARARPVSPAAAAGNLARRPGVCRAPDLQWERGGSGIHGKTMGKPWENHGKPWEMWWFHGDFMMINGTIMMIDGDPMGIYVFSSLWALHADQSATWHSRHSLYY